MAKSWIALLIAGCIGICLLLVTNTPSVRSGLAAAEDAAKPGDISRESPDLPVSTDSQEQRAQWAKQYRFISIPDVFEQLERPPVKFYHEKHTIALEPDSCGHCHPRNEEGQFTFTFPKVETSNDPDDVMNAYHDSCIECHKGRAAADKKTGPVTCGECHVIEKGYHRTEYLPILPDYYDILRDTYHKDCLACHREPAKLAKHAGALDWKSFYVKEQVKAEEVWPQVVFDYYLHDKHDKALPNSCELCHYISAEKQQLFAAEGKEPTSRDWIWEIDERNLLTEKEAAHRRCINCHLDRKDKKTEAGPVHCGQCHTGPVRAVQDMADVARMDCEQEERILIRIENDARAKAVAFDHKSHETYTRSCQDCHHKTLRACGECHTVDGHDDGNGITLAEAHHKVSSTWSCVGCHEIEKRAPTCAGCHQAREHGLVESACRVCHTDTLSSLDAVASLPSPKQLIPDDVKDEMDVGVMEDAYEPSRLPHLAIAAKLTDISNKSRLASYFHTDEMTICAGCHHMTPLAGKTTVPRCRACHTVREQSDDMTTTLLGAYHRQCLGCHRVMDGLEEEMPQSCTGCHKEKS